MQSTAAVNRRKAFQLYFMGHGAILVGAALMEYFHSMLPMALGASAGLMLTTPLLRHFGRRILGRAD